MFFKDISDSEVVQFHKGVKVNARLEEVLSRGSSGDYPFIIKEDGDVSKAVPLFYSDSISSDYEGVRVLDNQCLLYTGDLTNYPLIRFNSNTMTGGFDLIYTTSSVVGTRYLSVHLFDKYTLFGLRNTNVTVTEYNDTTLLGRSDLVTDSTGGVSIGLHDKTDKLTFNVDENTKTILLTNDKLILTVTGSTFKSYNSNITIGDTGGAIDFGDGTVTALSSGGYQIDHTYTDGETTHTIKVNGVTSLGYSYFYGCSGLTSISIPEGVTSLGDYCFSGCSGLTSISIPDSVTSLGNYCFSGCSGLTSITIPEGVTSLGDYCFSGCSGLTSIVLNWSEADDIVAYQKNWIQTANSYLKFSIPYGTTNLYTSKSYPSYKLTERGV